LITQMYFEGDPLIPHDSIIATIPDKSAADRLTARLDLNASRPLECLAYRFDIVLRGRRQTLFENKLLAEHVDLRYFEFVEDSGDIPCHVRDCVTLDRLIAQSSASVVNGNHSKSTR
jgi:intradiol ring-cleaving dioxygenase-like protein